MKKQLAILAFVGVLASSTLLAQSDTSEAEPPSSPAPSASTSLSQMADDAAADNMSFHEVLKDQFIQGNPTFMTPILICLILGLAFSIERIITLNLATTNTKKLLGQIEDALSKGGVNAALDITRN